MWTSRADQFHSDVVPVLQVPGVMSWQWVCVTYLQTGVGVGRRWGSVGVVRVWMWSDGGCGDAVGDGTSTRSHVIPMKLTGEPRHSSSVGGCGFRRVSNLANFLFLAASCFRCSRCPFSKLRRTPSVISLGNSSFRPKASSFRLRALFWTKLTSFSCRGVHVDDFASEAM